MAPPFHTHEASNQAQNSNHIVEYEEFGRFFSSQKDNLAEVANIRAETRGKIIRQSKYMQ